MVLRNDKFEIENPGFNALEHANCEENAIHSERHLAGVRIFTVKDDGSFAPPQTRPTIPEERRIDAREKTFAGR
jgi:hypothetical protein